MKNLGGKLFGAIVVVLLGTLLYLTVFSDGLGKAPNITVNTSNNTSLNLTKPMKPVLVNFWATTCPGCITEMPHLAEMKNKFGDKFEIVAVSMDYDPADQVQRFLAKNPFPFSFVMDTDGEIAKAFGGVLLTPTSFLIAPNGNIVYRIIGEVEFEKVTDMVTKMTPDL